jgi:hypothetical protein
VLVPRCSLLWVRPIIQSAPPAIEAHPRRVEVVRDPVVIYIANHRHIHTTHSGVVVEAPAAPVAAFIPIAVVAEPIIHATVEPDVRAPITVIPAIVIAGITPVARGPQRTDIRRHHPRAGNPVVPAVGRIGPVARRPQVVVARSFGLVVLGNRRRRVGCLVIGRVLVARRSIARILIAVARLILIARVLIVLIRRRRSRLWRCILRTRCALIRRWWRRILARGRRRVAGVGQVHRCRVVTAGGLRLILSLVLVAVATGEGKSQKRRGKKKLTKRAHESFGCRISPSGKLLCSSE